MHIRKLLVAGAALAAITVAAPAAAATFVFNLSSTNSSGAALNWTVNNLTLTATGGVYGGTLNSLKSVSSLPSLTPATITSNGNGLAVCSENNGDECKVLDTTGSNEVAGFSFSASSGYELAGSTFQLTGATFSAVNYTAPQGATRNKPAVAESGDQLLVYGGSATSAQYLGFGGFIGANSVPPLSGGVATLSFTNLPALEQFFFTLGATGQDLRIQSLTFEGSAPRLIPVVVTPDVTAVPEPATWAMMILGFAAAGSMLRRRRLVPARA